MRFKTFVWDRGRSCLGNSCLIAETIIHLSNMTVFLALGYGETHTHCEKWLRFHGERFGFAYTLNCVVHTHGTEVSEECYRIE